MPPDAHWEAAQSVLEEALSLVTGDRNDAYGPPEEDFDHIGQLWTAALGTKLTHGAQVDRADVAHMMILLKIARDLFQQPKRDSIVDIVGYAACLARIRHQAGSWD